MPLFNNAATAASFKTSTNLNPNENDITGNNKKNRNGMETRKSELVKQDVPISVTVLRLVLPMTKDDYYMDLDNATTEQVLEESRGRHCASGETGMDGSMVEAR
jgi:hypothetical protein